MDSDLRVLLVGNYLSRFGASRSISEELAARLPEAGCRVITTSGHPRRIGRLIDMVGTAWRERRQYAVAQVDVFSGAAFFWAEAVCATLGAARRPYVLTLHGGSLPVFSARHPRRVRRLLQSAAAVTTPSGYLLQELTPYRADIRFIPNGLDVRRYVPRPPGAARPRLVWLRAFHRVYNPELAVAVLPRLVDRFPDLRLTMIGPDKGDGSLADARRLAQRLGVDHHVEFREAVPKVEVPRALADADIFLNTTNVDSAPVTVVEAMACGLCVVTTDVGGCPFLVEHEREGLLVPPREPAAMAAAIERILDEPGLARRLARNGRTKAKRFDWAPIVSEWRELLESTARQAA